MRHDLSIPLKGRQEQGELRRGIGLEMKRLARDRVFESQHPRMERLARQLLDLGLNVLGQGKPLGMSRSRDAVNGVSKERRALSCQMHPDLVSSSRFKPGFDPACERLR